VTNISYNCLAINGGKGNNPPFVIQNNAFYLPGNGENGISTQPGDNVSIISNQFIYPVSSHGQAIVLGAAGAQGNFESSNIVVAYNNFENAAMIIELGGGNLTNSTDPYRVENVQVYGNTSSWMTQFLQNYGGFYTNVHFFSNSVAIGFDPGDGKNRASFASGAGGAQYVWVDINNLYYSPIYNFGGTKSISYGSGSRYEIIYGYTAGSAYALSDSDSNQIPPGAQILIQNDNTSSASIPVYLNSACTRGPVIIPAAQAQTFSWANGGWAISSQPVNLSPPGGLHVIGQ
jgi:hypothetical protein